MKKAANSRLKELNLSTANGKKSVKKPLVEEQWKTSLRQVLVKEFTKNGTLGVVADPVTSNGKTYHNIQVFKKPQEGNWQCIYTQVTENPKTVLESRGVIEFAGEIYESGDISGLREVGDFLVIGADEGNKVQILKREGGHYRWERDIILSEDEKKEIDIEGIACEGEMVYVIGSHSCKRPRMKAENTYETNRKLIEKVLYEKNRDKLFRFRLDKKTGNVVGNIEKTSLRGLINNNAVLKRFRRLPSKENGVDIEGIAVKNGFVYIGFRGPVLRGNYVPILRCKFAERIDASETLFANLGGCGVRDMVRVQQGFLILAGPVGDGPGSYQLYFWDGMDCLPGQRASGVAPGQCVYLCDIPTPENAKAEGITVVQENESFYEFIIVYDSLEKGGAMRFRLTKPLQDQLTKFFLDITEMINHQ
jgi:hypothetical protein